MKVYKYRDFSSPSEEEFQRLATILHRRALWCARPDTLNDPEEFGWRCDYVPTSNTIELIARLLVACCGRSLPKAREIAAVAVNANRLRPLAEPVMEDLKTAPQALRSASALIRHRLTECPEATS